MLSLSQKLLINNYILKLYKKYPEEFHLRLSDLNLEIILKKNDDFFTIKEDSDTINIYRIKKEELVNPLKDKNIGKFL